MAELEPVRCGLGPAIIGAILQSRVDRGEITIEQAVAAFKNPNLLMTILAKKEPDNARQD